MYRADGPVRLRSIVSCIGVLLVVAGCAGPNYDRSNPDWAQAGMAPLAKSSEADRPWIETEAPPPPAFDVGRSLRVAMPAYTSLRLAIDPDTISLSNADGLVRYVVIASDSAGQPINAFYEAIRCSTEEMKTYARWSAGKWDAASSSDWIRFGSMKSSHAKALAQQALCRDHATRESVRHMLRELRDPEALRK